MRTNERRVRIYISGEFRWIPSDWWTELEGPRPPHNFDNDGCSYSPDYTVTNEVLWPACIIHDWHYRHGPALKISRMEADAIFRRNLKKLMKWQGVSWLRRQWYAWSRWSAVRWLGRDHYDQ